MKNLIKTMDENTASELRNAGYPELSKQGQFFVFVNIGKNLTFTEEDKKKMVFTNIVCL